MAPSSRPASSIRIWIPYCSAPSISYRSGLAAAFVARKTSTASPFLEATIPQHSFGASSRACETISSKS